VSEQDKQELKVGDRVRYVERMRNNKLWDVADLQGTVVKIATANAKLNIVLASVNWDGAGNTLSNVEDLERVS
jgi:hypothetical protein